MITMSRIAKNPVQIPAGVSVALTNGVLSVKGKLGELSQPIHSLVSLSIGESEIETPGAISSTASCNSLE